MKSTEELRMELRERPDRRPAMFQSWRNLSFLHWEADPVELQNLLPEGLTVETYEGRAYVGLVLFTMLGVRLAWLPELPGTSAFHETNVRTYVVDDQGVPGVWFFSLEAASATAVRVARRSLGLPYHFARMILDDGGAFVYESERLWPQPVPAECAVRVGDLGNEFEARPGTLEFWLIERYLLYSQVASRLKTIRVWHEPYRVRTARCLACDESLIAAIGATKSGMPDIVHFSDGVDVDIFALCPSTPST